jgi:hypothetical protein
VNTEQQPLLILAVTLIVLTLVLTGSPTWLVILAVIIILLALILVIGGAANLLPIVLRTVLSELRRLIRR